MRAIQEAVLYGLMSYGRQVFVRHSNQLHAGLFDGDLKFIFSTISGLHEQGKPVDLVTVAEAAPESPVLEIGKTFIGREAMGGYIDLLHEDYAERAKADIGAALMAGEIDRESAIKSLRDLDARAPHRMAADLGTGMQEWLGKVEAGIENPEQALNTGWVDLDRLLGGIRGGNLTILAGRPSMGKTAAAVNIAACQDRPVLIFSLEMDQTEIIGRMISAHGIDHERLRSPRQLTDQDWPKITAAMQAFHGKRIFVNDTGGLPIHALEAIAQQAHATQQVGLIVVDYLQLVTCKAERRHEEVAEVSRRLKALAKNLHVPVLAVSQLNRAVEGRVKPIPNMSDLRESGQIEQDADQIIFVHRPEVYDKTDKPGLAEMHLKKNRHGQTGTVTLAWQGQYQRFVDYAPDHYPRAVA